MIRRLCVATALVAWLLPTAVLADADAGDEELRALMDAMQSSSGVRAEFVEEKRIALLSAPVVSEGGIYFAPPNSLLRMTRDPADTRLLIIGDDVRYRDDAGADRFDLSANSVARQFVENFLVLFTGDLEELRSRYEVSAKFEGEEWSLQLVPRRSPFNRIVERVQLKGKGRSLSSIEMVEKDGDSTMTNIVKMDPDAKLSPVMLDRMFEG